MMRAREFMQYGEADEVSERAGTIEPEGSLNADQWRRRSKRQASAQQKLRDEQTRHAAKLRDLRDRLHDN